MDTEFRAKMNKNSSIFPLIQNYMKIELNVDNNLPVLCDAQWPNTRPTGNLNSSHRDVGNKTPLHLSLR